MAVLGVVLVVDVGGGRDSAALSALAVLPGLSLGERRGGRVAAVLCAPDSEARDILDRASEVPGVLGVHPVFHALDDVLDDQEEPG